MYNRKEELAILHESRAKVAENNDKYINTGFQDIIEKLFENFPITMPDYAEFTLAVHPCEFMIELLDEEYAWDEKNPEYKLHREQIEAVKGNYCTIEDKTDNVLSIDNKKMIEILDYLEYPYKNDKNFSEKYQLENMA